LKFGFEKENRYADATGYSIGEFRVVYIHTDGDFLYDRLEIKYVHKLQNLYFELEGKELEIK